VRTSRLPMTTSGRRGSALACSSAASRRRSLGSCSASTDVGKDRTTTARRPVIKLCSLFATNGCSDLCAGFSSRRSRIQFPATATNTGMGDRLLAGKPPQYSTKPPRPTRLLLSTGREMSISQSAATICGWGLKAGMVHFICG